MRILILLTLLFVGAANAADSPQFGGPTRNDIFQDTGLLKAWPEGGPPLS